MGNYSFEVKFELFGVLLFSVLAVLFHFLNIKVLCVTCICLAVYANCWYRHYRLLDEISKIANKLNNKNYNKDENGDEDND